MTDVKVTPFAEGTMEPFDVLPCAGYAASGAPSLAQVEDLLDKLAPRHPGHRPLATLDNLNQAAYTSGHAIGFHELDADDGVDGDIEPDALAPRALFMRRRRNLLAKTAAIDFIDLGGVLNRDGRDGGLVEFTQRPERILSAADETILIQAVPVEIAAEALAAFPNGYFSDDLSPMQVLVLSRRLGCEHEFGLFGVGASHLGFRRAAPLTSGEAARLGRDLLFLHNSVPALADAALAATLTGRTSCFIRYVSE